MNNTARLGTPGKTLCTIDSAPLPRVAVAQGSVL